MSIALEAPPFEAQQWPQGDARDPLGVWGMRQGVTGDASAGNITVTCSVPAARRSAFVYTCYNAHIAQLTGTLVSTNWKVRLLTSWPDIDPLAGVQAFASLAIGSFLGTTGFSAPIAGPFGGSVGAIPFINSIDRFLLLYDPRQPASLGNTNILELQLAVNTDLATYSFEAYGY
ncbi:MAG: hypothetical protein ACUZ8A_06865, partial [Candidatus Bathyanammoxibius sp.]